MSGWLTRQGLEGVEFDDLLREVLTRVDGVLDEQARLRLLLDAVVTMAADLSLDGVLSRIVTIASNLVDAQYAALGVLDVGRDRLRTFIHHGMTDDQVVEIGELPVGARSPGTDHRPARAAAPARPHRPPGVVRHSAGPPADELVPRRARCGSGTGCSATST